MKLLCTLLICFLLLFGCMNEPQKPPPAPSENTTKAPATENRTTIIIKPTPLLPEENKTETPKRETENKKLGPRITPGYTETPRERFAIYFINVGKQELQGDAILIKKGDFDLLIDAGNPETGATVVDFLKSRGVDDIEVLVSTQADSEQYGGIEKVIDNFGVEQFWWTGKLYGDSTYDQLIRKADNKNITIKEAGRGQHFLFNSMNISVLNPNPTKSFGDRNNDAIVLKITQDQFCILLTSNILAGAQAEIINLPNVTTRCAILQMPGHGLGRSTTNIGQFLLRVAPLDVIFSGSANDPSADRKGTRFIAYDKLNASKIRYYENYKGGTVRVTSDGSSYSIDYLTE